ncbi:hypothetical protein BDP27DRAFT_1410908 [Rhodocollybia butyracea]|uniref:FAD-binding PCMH-type domain-containing protein n=1 Tax=Rhodocollybia butyracea TaxID=206335 RepID=A0A9P5P4Q0_9AGAR|nr:hypothetical protein BDP27DRAFT_1410908 [Rhodocollybia butyracea]
MKMLSLLFSLLAIALAEASQTPLSVTTDPIDSVQLCCTALSEALPSLVYLPGSAEYEHQQHTYFILQHTEIQPSCRVSPATTSDVSFIMTTLTKHSCPFAVRSGGHMTWAGSNVVGGVTLDLGRLNEITVEEEKSLVRLGPGSNWGSVYAAMEPYNLTTVGGRMPEVGVGGFFLGGGISLLSFQHGFGSDNILNYELVLSNGTILNANSSSHPDLFWALKLGSSNFGIVTRFDVRTYPLKPHVWGGIRAYPLTTSGTPTLISNWVTFARSEAAKREELQALILGREEIHAKGMFDELELEFEEMRWNLLFQPVTQGFVSASEETGETLSGSHFSLSPGLIHARLGDEPCVAHLMCMERIPRRQRDIFNDFLYLNYANDEQDVYGRSISNEDLERMREVKGVYDKEGILGDYGGVGSRFLGVKGMRVKERFIMRVLHGANCDSNSAQSYHFE